MASQTASASLHSSLRILDVHRVDVDPADQILQHAMRWLVLSLWRQLSVLLRARVSRGRWYCYCSCCRWFCYRFSICFSRVGFRTPFISLFGNCSCRCGSICRNFGCSLFCCSRNCGTVSYLPVLFAPGSLIGCFTKLPVVVNTWLPLSPLCETVR